MATIQQLSLASSPVLETSDTGISLVGNDSINTNGNSTESGQDNVLSTDPLLLAQRAEEKDRIVRRRIMQQRRDNAIDAAKQTSTASQGSQNSRTVVAAPNKSKKEKTQLNQEKIRTAVLFLKHPKVKDAALANKIGFLTTKKGLTEAEVSEALRLAGVTKEEQEEDEDDESPKKKKKSKRRSRDDSSDDDSESSDDERERRRAKRRTEKQNKRNKAIAPPPQPLVEPGFTYKKVGAIAAAGLGVSIAASMIWNYLKPVVEEPVEEATT